MKVNYTAEELRQMCCETFAQLRAGKLDWKDASARSGQIREIGRLFNIQMKGLTHLGCEYTPEMRRFLKGGDYAKKRG